MYKNNLVTALVPLKEHSERIKNKNMRDFSGKPLYHYIIETLLNIDYIDEIIINTDGNDLERDINLFFPTIKVHHRPKYLHGDFVSMNDIIKYDIENSESEFFLQTHATNPLIKPETIKEAIREFFNNLSKYDSLFTVNKLQCRLYDISGNPINHDPDKLIRTQDLTPAFEENSNLYLFSKNSFCGNQCKRIGRKPLIFEQSKLESVDIDEEEDFLLAEYIYKARIAKI